MLRNTLMVLALLTIVWIGFLVVTFVLAYTLFPAIEFPDKSLLTGLIRVAIGMAAIASWIYGWYILTRMWLRKMLS